MLILISVLEIVQNLEYFYMDLFYFFFKLIFQENVLHSISKKKKKNRKRGRHSVFEVSIGLQIQRH